MWTLCVGEPSLKFVILGRYDNLSKPGFHGETCTCVCYNKVGSSAYKIEIFSSYSVCKEPPLVWFFAPCVAIILHLCWGLFIGCRYTLAQNTRYSCSPSRHFTVSRKFSFLIYFMCKVHQEPWDLYLNVVWSFLAHALRPKVIGLSRLLQLICGINLRKTFNKQRLSTYSSQNWRLVCSKCIFCDWLCAIFWWIATNCFFECLFIMHACLL